MRDVDPLDPLREQLAKAWSEIGALRATPEGFTPDQLEEIASRTCEAIEAAWTALGLPERELWDKIANYGLEQQLLHRDAPGRRIEPYSEV